MAKKYRQLCHLDKQFLTELLDAQVEMTGNFFDGSSHCSYLIRPRVSEMEG